MNIAGSHRAIFCPPFDWGHVVMLAYCLTRVRTLRWVFNHTPDAITAGEDDTVDPRTISWS